MLLNSAKIGFSYLNRDQSRDLPGYWRNHLLSFSRVVPLVQKWPILPFFPHTILEKKFTLEGLKGLCSRSKPKLDIFIKNNLLCWNIEYVGLFTLFLQIEKK